MNYENKMQDKCRQGEGVKWVQICAYGTLQVNTKGYVIMLSLIIPTGVGCFQTI